MTSTDYADCIDFKRKEQGEVSTDYADYADFKKKIGKRNIHRLRRLYGVK